MNYDNPWKHNLLGPISEDNIPDGAKAFVYIITNTKTNKKYVGKKTLFFAKSKKLKNGRRKRSTVNSDWKSYYGSNKELLSDIELLGKENFTREIVRFCYSKGEANYHEAFLQFKYEVLFGEDWYNSWISVKISRKHVLRK